MPYPTARSALACAFFAVAIVAGAACDGSALSAPGASPPHVTGDNPGNTGPGNTGPGNTGDVDGSVNADGGTTLPDGAVVPPPPDMVTIVVEPTDKAQALLTAIQNATSSIHMTMYLLDDKRFITALIAQHNAGREVKVVLNQMFQSGGTNQSSYTQLQAAGVPVAWAPSTFTLTHEKCVLIDGSQAWIMTMNLEYSSPSNREYLAIDTQAADIKEAEAIFEADFTGAPITPTGNLLVAPVNARSRLATLIEAAKTSVDVEAEELSDTTIVNALITAQKAGATVRIVLADNTPTPSQSNAVAQLKGAGIKLVSVSSPYIHAKAVAVDGQSAYVGSENFTTSSLQYNRELGLITTTAANVSSIQATIAKDFGIGTAL
jgi:phosphatidylserine/phosphatidylglycerophosphate/cardiolipin synthase-like enzyme